MANPYQPPSHPAGSVSEEETSPQGTFALRVSIGLAAVGFALSSGTLGIAVLSRLSDPVPSDSLEMQAALAMLIAACMHVVGIAIMLASPRGRRWQGVIVNAFALACLLTLAIWGVAL